MNKKVRDALNARLKLDDQLATNQLNLGELLPDDLQINPDRKGYLNVRFDHQGSPIERSILGEKD